MKNQNNNFSHVDPSARPSVRPSVRPSIFATLEDVKAQVEFDCFERTTTAKDGRTWKSTDPIYEEICLIIAEVYVMDPDGMIRISGADLTVSIVQEVYAKLGFEHLEAVVINFQRITTQVYNKKAYLRTALYNAVFEMNIGVTNDIAQTMPWLYSKPKSQG